MPPELSTHFAFTCKSSCYFKRLSGWPQKIANMQSLWPFFHSRTSCCIISKMHSQWFECCKYLWSLLVYQRLLKPKFLVAFNWFNKYSENKVKLKVKNDLQFIFFFFFFTPVQKISRGLLGVSAKIYVFKQIHLYTSANIKICRMTHLSEM